MSLTSFAHKSFTVQYLDSISLALEKILTLSLTEYLAQLDDPHDTLQEASGTQYWVVGA